MTPIQKNYQCQMKIESSEHWKVSQVEHTNTLQQQYIQTQILATT